MKSNTKSNILWGAGIVLAALLTIWAVVEIAIPATKVADYERYNRDTNTQLMRNYQKLADLGAMSQANADYEIARIERQERLAAR